MPTPLDYLALHLDTLFVCDSGGRLLRVNERSNVNSIPPAPLVYVGRTPLGNIGACQANLPAPLRRRVEDLLAAEPVLPTCEEPPRCRELLYTLLAEHGPAWDEESGPAFTFPADIPVPAGVVPITGANGHLLRAHYPDVLADLDTSLPCIAVVEDGAAVSVCFSARTTTRTAAAGVLTQPEARGRGYAVAVTAGWALAIRERGAISLYSTTWDNLASRAVAHRLGLELYAADWWLTASARRPKNHP